MSTEAFKPGDKVKIRDDALTGGEQFGDLFRELVWTVVTINGDSIEVSAKHEETELKMHSLTWKFRLWTPS